MKYDLKKILVLGSGLRKYDKDITTIDRKKSSGVDIICDISKETFPFKDNTFDLIISEHVFEHLGWNDEEDGLIHCLDECYRIIKPSGKIYFVVPLFPSGMALMNPEHRRFFIRDSFSFFQVPKDGLDVQGGMKGHWHTEFIEEETNENQLAAFMYPNKKGGKYPYVKIKKVTMKGTIDQRRI